MIDLSGWDANQQRGRQPGLHLRRHAPLSPAPPASSRYFDDGTDTWVQGDINGDGVADFEIALTGVLTPVATDFIL